MPTKWNQTTISCWVTFPNYYSLSRVHMVKSAKLRIGAINCKNFLAQFHKYQNPWKSRKFEKTHEISRYEHSIQSPFCTKIRELRYNIFFAKGPGIYYVLHGVIGLRDITYNITISQWFDMRHFLRKLKEIYFQIKSYDSNQRLRE